MSNSDKTSLGDRMKGYESVAESKLLSGLPIIARIDGRAFHTFTSGLSRPYCDTLSQLMAEVTMKLVKESDALVGYTQSDEISLLFFAKDFKSQVFFDGRRDKLVSNLASMATYFFNEGSQRTHWSKSNVPAFFDCRAFNTPSKMEAYNYFLWRERDATKNSISMAAQANFSHKELHGKNSSDKQEMLFKMGINWNDYPDFFKRGTYVQRIKEKIPFTCDELAKLPVNHQARKNPDLLIERSSVKIVQAPPLSQVANKVEFIFAEEAPRVSYDNQSAKE
jgi:tRNA(His) guanylyltransferase